VVTWLLGIPSSSSHALLGGIIGATSLEAGIGVIKLGGLTKIAIALFFSPVIGLAAGYLLMKLVLFLVRGASPRVNHWFKRMQTVTALALALSHGTNGAQKTMGIITMALVTTGYLSDFAVPRWVIVISAGAIALGSASGGWRIIRTLGTKFYKIRPIHGFTTQAASAAIILGSALLGGPVSTTHVVSSVILGVGSGERVSKVRWRVAREIAISWLLTIPASAAMAALLYLGLSYLGVGQ
jgi:PiT family inorganic phosphate transporter